MQLSMMQPWPIGPWAQGWLSASTCVPSRKTAMRSPPGIATIRALLSGMDWGADPISVTPRSVGRSVR